MIKKIFTLFSKLSCIAVIGLLPVAGYAQVSVQATGGTLTGTYTTVNAAFAAINAGTHQGAIIINVVGNTTEPATPVPLLRSNGSSSYTSVLIRPQGGNFTINSDAAPVASRGILELAGADNVTIDGDDVNTPGTRNLTIQSVTSSNSGIACIRVASNSTTGADGADNITIKNCNIVGSRNSATTTTISYGIQFSNGTSTSSSTTGAYSNLNNLFENNQITRAYYGIYAYGSSNTSYLNSNLIIRNNTIGSAVSDNNIGNRGIYVSYTSTTATGRAQITGNDIRVGNYDNGGYAASIAGIEVNAANNSILVSRNNIHDVVQPSTAGWGAYGVFFSSATNNTNQEVSNNFIRDCKMNVYQTSTTSTYLPIGIFFNASVTSARVINNTIVMNDQVNTHATYSTYGVLAISGATFSHFLNNIVINKFGSDNSFAVYLGNTNAFTSVTNALVNNNCYFVSGNGKIGYYGANATTLADWKRLTGKEANSIDESPAFVSATDLHITAGSLNLLESGGAAVSVTGVNTDIDGDTRPGPSSFGFGTAPDIGADEFDGRRGYTCVTPPNPGNTIASDTLVCSGATIQLSVQNTPTGTGLSFQWQQSADGIAYTNINNATLSTTSAMITAPLYFRLRVLCAAGTDTSYSTPRLVKLPHVISSVSTPTAICGIGQRTITATTQQATSIVNWYNVPAGGSSLFTGNTFQTPLINTTTTFYAEPSGGMMRENMPSPSIGTSTFITATAGWGLHFEVFNSVSIDSVTIKAQATSAGNATIQIVITDINDVVVYTGVSHNFAITSTPTEYQIPVMISGVAPGIYKMGMRYTGISDMVRESGTLSFPYTSSGNEVSITAGANGTGNARTTSAYYWFYKWVISKGCAGARVPVTVTVNPGPAFDVSDDFTICNSAVKPVSVKAATLNNYDQVVWSPVTNLYTDAAGTIPYTANTPLKTVYYKSATPGVFSLIANATNTTTDCRSIDSLKITVLPATVEVGALVKNFCNSGSTVINVKGNANLGTATVQWQESGDNVTFTNIAGATGLSYTTPVLTTTRYYRVQLSLDNAFCSITSVADTVRINTPAVLNVSGVSSCDSGRFTIAASPSGANAVKWYETATSSAVLHIGNSFLTPMISTNTTYYASAFSGGIDTITVGTGTAVSSGYPNPFSKVWGGNRHQYLITAQELTALGATRGIIRSVALDIVTLSTTGTSAQQTMNDMTIRMAHSTNANMSGGFQTTGLQTVYNANFLPAATGWNQLAFTTPFDWDGTSNVIIEFTSNSGNGGGGGQHTIRHTTTSFVSGYYKYADNVTPATTATFWATTSGTNVTTSNRANMRFIFDDLCESPRMPVNVVILPKTAAEVTPNGNVGLCDGSSRTLKSVHNASAYVWLRNGVAIANSNKDSLVVTSTGDYRLVTIENTCTDTSDVITVGNAPSPFVDLGNNYDICRNTTTVLDARNTADAILWDDNSTNVLRTVNRAGTYHVAVTNSWNCVSYDTIVIGYLPHPDPQLGNDTALCLNQDITLNPGAFSQYLWSNNTTQPTLVVSNPGRYYVTVTNSFGCKEADTVQVGLYPSAEVQGFTYIPYFFEQRGKVQFAPINPQNVSHYSWDFGDNSALSTGRDPLHVYGAEGKYLVKLSVTNDICPPRVYQQEITLNFTTDISDVKGALKAKLYPNPAQEVVNVELDDVTVAIVGVEVYDILGRKVQNDAALQGYKAILDTRVLVSGVYQVVIQTTKGIYKAKFEIVK